MVAISGHADGVDWRLPLSLQTLYGQVMAQWPGRATGADGTIGDAAHQAQGAPRFDGVTGRALGGTDHLPDALGLVCALDITHDPSHGCDGWALMLAIAASRDARIDYMEAEAIRDGEKWETSPRTGWLPRLVDTSSAGRHLHISILHLLPLADSRAPWAIMDHPPPPPRPKEHDMLMVKGPGPTVLLVGVAPHPTTVASPGDANAFTGAGVNTAIVSQQQFDQLAALAK